MTIGSMSRFTKMEGWCVYFTWISSEGSLWTLLTTCKSKGASEVELELFNRSIKTMLQLQTRGVKKTY